MRSADSPAHVNPEPIGRGSPLGGVYTASGGVTITVGESRRENKRELNFALQSPISTVMPQERVFLLNTDRDRLRFGQITLPECKWAKEIGRDVYGLWAEFEVSKVRQRLRWIPPGRFWMGSPEEEEGRYRK